MNFGQMSIKKLSPKADYLQLDICGLTASEAVERYKNYQKNIPVVLHGDWTKKGCSENNIKERLKDYIDTVRRLKEETDVLGFTMHPTFRKKVSFDEFYQYCLSLQEKAEIEVWIENRSNSRIWLSTPSEIIAFSKRYTMTIDLAQLYISCGYSNQVLKETLSSLDWKQVRELHVSNVKRTEKNTFVARKIHDGEIVMAEILPLICSVPFWTLEILGGVPTFEAQVEEILHMKEKMNKPL